MKINLCVLLLAANTSIGFASEKEAETNTERVLQATDSSEVAGALSILAEIAGVWSGVTEIFGQEVPITAVYKKTSGGNAVTEELTIGDQQMVSVYHIDAGKVRLSHYCSWGNNPQMKLSKLSSKSVAFELQKVNGLKSDSDPHMRGVVLALNDKGGLRQNWDIVFEGGIRGQVIVDLTRSSD